MQLKPCFTSSPFHMCFMLKMLAVNVGNIEHALQVSSIRVPSPGLISMKVDSRIFLTSSSVKQLDKCHNELLNQIQKTVPSLVASELEPPLVSNPLGPDKLLLPLSLSVSMIGVN